MHTVKGFIVVSEVEVDAFFLEFSCFFDESMDVGNLISGSSAFSKSNLNVWKFLVSISPANEYSGLISFRIDWFDLFVVQGTLKSLLQHHSLKIPVLQHSALCIIQLLHMYMTTEKKHNFGYMDLCQQNDVSVF